MPVGIYYHASRIIAPANFNILGVEQIFVIKHWENTNYTCLKKAIWFYLGGLVRFFAENLANKIAIDKTIMENHMKKFNPGALEFDAHITVPF